MFLVLAVAAVATVAAKPGHGLIKASPQFRTLAECQAALKRQHQPTPQRSSAAPAHHCVAVAGKTKGKHVGYDLATLKK